MRSGAPLALATVSALTVARMLRRRGSRAGVRPIVFLDLDETLLRSLLLKGTKADLLASIEKRKKTYRNKTFTDNPQAGKMATFGMERAGRQLAWAKRGIEVVFPDGDRYLVVTRPGIENELRDLVDHADLCVLSAGAKDYVDLLLVQTGLRAMIPFVYSSRQNNDLSWAQGRPWVLVDDLEFSTASTQIKLRQILGLNPMDDDVPVPDQYKQNVIKVDAFQDALPDAKPITGLAGRVKRRLGVVAGSGGLARSAQRLRGSPHGPGREA